MPEFRAGQIIPPRYKNREIKAIIWFGCQSGEKKVLVGNVKLTHTIPDGGCSRRVAFLPRPKAAGLPCSRTLYVSARYPSHRGSMHSGLSFWGLFTTVDTG